MTEYQALSAFMIGLAGGVHCFGMCGGVVGALSFMLPKDRSHWPYLLMYNAGRIISYTIAGGLVGYLGQIISARSVVAAQTLNIISGVFLVLLGLYLAQWWRVLQHIEGIGKKLWQYIQPLSKRFLPLQHPLSALPYGMIWGWLPCGLVYSTLTWSLASGSAVEGAVLMMSFGLGTLPALLAFGAGSVSIKAWLTNPIVRQIIGLILVLYGVFLIYHGLPSRS
jgi:sulfite exporter TauE/SafE